MYNSNYEDYMRNVLGYSVMPQDTYQMQDSIYEIPQSRNFDSRALEELYPEIYKLVYPMIQKVCMKTGSIINEEMIEKMTDDIYNVLEEEEKKETDNLKRNTDTKTGINQTTRKIDETRHRNYMLRDLIKILILRELLERRPPMRPPMPPPPMRPPMRPPRY